MPAPGAGGVQTSFVGTVQSMMVSARRVPPQAATRATTRRARPEPGRRQATRPISANSPKTSNDLEKFVPWSDLDPVYFDSSYYLYPDGPVAVEMLRVIGAAMAEAGVVGLGRLTARADGCRRAARHRDGSFHFACRGGGSGGAVRHGRRRARR